MSHTILTGCKKARRCGLWTSGIAVVLDNAIKSKFKACRCGLGTSDARKDLQWILEP